MSAVKKPHISDSHLQQIEVLRSMSGSGESRQFEISEIAEMTGLKDEKEVQRVLYILEGQKLVAPFPAGDFTSKRWHITSDGLKALKVITRSRVQ